MRDDAARRWFERFHAGQRPEWVDEVVKQPAWLADLGPAVAIAYLRKTPRGPELRVHEWQPHARPTLARTDSGTLDFVGGAYTVKENGIVDKALTVVPARVGTTALQAPRYTPQGLAVHGRCTPAEGCAIPRANPIGMVELRQGGARLVDAGITGGTALVTVGVTDLAVERTTWTEGVRAAVQVTAPSVPGLALLLTDAHAVGAGLIAGGIVGGGLRFARSRQWDRLAAAAITRWLPAGSARDGAALFDNDPGGGADVRVEAMAQG